MSLNQKKNPLTIKRIVFLSCALLFALWLAMMVNSWINVQRLESNHQIEDLLQDTTLTTHIILKSINEALLTDGTIPPLNVINNKSKEFDLLLNKLKNSRPDDDLILSFVKNIVEEKLALDKKIKILIEWPEGININDTNVMLVAGSITAIGESMLIKIKNLNEHVNKKVLLAKRNIQNTIILTAIFTAVISLLIFLFLYKGISRPFNILLHTAEMLEIEKAVAEKASQAKSEFLSRMSHELRTPMNAILGFGQILKLNADELSEIHRGNVIEILDAGYHLLNLIDEVLDLAKIESGKLEIQMEEVSVDEVIKQCVTLISPQVDARQLEFIEHDSDKGYTVHADFTRLKQVLLNLLSNAVKYNSNHGRITVDSQVVDKQRLRIRVTDTGEGLTDEEIAILFIPFERLSAANNVEGTGIGLVITKNLVELMGGVMGVESIPGEGCTFWVELELSRDV